MIPPRRLALLALVVTVGAGALSGCRAVDNLGEEYVSAHFVLGTSLAERNRVAHACATPDVVPQALPDSPDDPVARLDLVRFRVDKASAQELTQLYQCLRGFPSVTRTDAPVGP